MRGRGSVARAGRRADNPGTVGTEIAGAVQIRLLGPLEVWRDGEPVRLGGERQRALLAVFLIHANEVVSVERLIEQLFGGERSDSAVKAARVAVSRLRRLLETGGDRQVLQTRPGGYRLSLAPDQLDVTSFERLLGDGRRLLAGGDAIGAAARLREALGLWRGAPLADLGLVEDVLPEIRRLEELRLLTVIERIDADLALGAGAELIAELETLIAAEPLQERLRGQLMLALYRAGRQTDGLAVYREISALLRDELGLEPGRALQELERLILEHDASLDAAVPAAKQPWAGNLPAAATRFVGRARELEEVTALLWRSGTRLVTLTGAGGSGKTRLAHRVAEVSAQDYRDGAWFVGFSDITDPDLISSTICQAVGLADQPDVTPTDRLRGWLVERKVLLLLDNLEQLVGGTAVLAELLAGCREVTLLVTSREPLHLAGEQQYEVPVLDPGEAVELFTARTRAIAPNLIVDPEVAGGICERLDRLPLAIELAAARSKTLPPADILARLEQRLPVLAAGPRDAPRRQRTLTGTIDWSYDLLSDPEQRLFARLAVFTGGWALAAAEAVCDADLDTLQALTDRSLIRVDDGRYSMLQTLQEYALEKLEGAAELDHMRRRHAHWYVELLQPRASLYRESAEASMLARRAVVGLENCRGALDWAAANGESETAGWLIVSMSRWVWYPRGLLHEAERWLGYAREHLADYPLLLQARVLGAARKFAWKRGAHDDTTELCDRALAIYRELGHAEGICIELSARSTSATDRGDLMAARTALQQAIVHARANGVPEFLPTGLCNLGDLAIEEDDLDEARAHCEEGLTLAESGAMTEATPWLLTNLTHIANLQSRHTDAAELGRKTVIVALDRDDSLLTAAALMEIAWVLAEQGEPKRAGRLLGAGLGFHETAGATLQRTDRVCEDRTCHSLRAQLDEHRVQTLLDEGRNLPLEQAVRDALTESPVGSPAREIA